MTREDIIRMAREAGFESHDAIINYPKELQRFAAVVAAAEREERAMIDKNRIPSYWFVQSGEETTGPTYVVGRGDEEITHPCLFRDEAQAIVDALNALQEKNHG